VGLFESAAGGTVLLDEIGEMPMSMQVKLLHVLQERQILRVGGTRSIDLDIRIIAATNVDLKKAIDEGRFREDLFYRLNVVGIHLPKLREKREDISLLCAYFIDKFNLAFNKKVKKLSPQTLELLNRYHYPGNVRELENIIQRAVALAEGTTIHLRDLPARLTQDKPWHFADEKLLSMDDMEKGHILKVLNSTGFNKTETCSILKLSRTTLWRRMKKLNIPFPDN